MTLDGKAVTMKAAIERAEEAMARRDWATATVRWRDVLGEFGDRAPRKAHLRMSQALRRNGNITGAQAVLIERLNRDPDADRLRRELADLAASQAEWERAAELWGEVVDSAAAPTPEMANGLAEALCQLGRFSEADDALRRALDAGIDARDIRSVFDSEVLRAQFLGRFDQVASDAKGQAFEEDLLEWYRLAIGARRLRDASGLNAATTAPSAVWVSDHGQWGNTVLQLVNALEVAERLEVPRVYTPPAWYLEQDRPINIRGCELIQSEDPSPEEPLVLRGRFLLLRALDAAVSEAESPHLRLAELRPFTRFRDREPLGDDDLVIHIRAGEVFRKERVNRVYGQPPLAYYLMVLRHRPWRSVHVVYENDRNPVIEPLLDHLRAQGIEPTTVVTDLTSTVELLLSAHTIVAGRGTFIPTIAGLSSNLRRLYTFEGASIPQFDRWEEPPGVEQIDAVDEPGEYRRAVLSSNWEHRPDQVDLMLRYPQSALRLVPAAERRAMRTGESGVSPASRTA